MTRITTKIIACKLLRKCRKEEVPFGVVVAVAQCAEGTTLNWAPYLLNLFLDNCKDAAGFGDKISLLMATHPDLLDQME
jgi:hypothetical protein